MTIIDQLSGVDIVYDENFSIFLYVGTLSYYSLN